MPITFYDFEMALSLRRARIIAGSKNVPHDTVQINMMSYEQMCDACRAVNPNCTVPALQLEGGFGMAVAHALRNMNPSMRNRVLTGPYVYEQTPKLSARDLMQITNFIEMLESHMERREVISSDSLSIADITAACTLSFAKVVGKRITKATSNMRRWKDGLKERPSFGL